MVCLAFRLVIRAMNIMKRLEASVAALEIGLGLNTGLETTF